MAKKLAEMINKLKVAIYIRVSTHWQIDKDSLPLQKEDLINYCKYALGIHDFVIFEDAGYSAKNTDRPDYQKMMARLRTGEFSHVLVWKIDRISRNLLDFAGMYQELKDLGITFVSKNEQFDTSSAMGEAMLKIILVFAELERNMTSERVTAVMLSRAGNGQWNGGKVPFGYNYDSESKTFTVNAEEAYIVRSIYSEYSATRSLLVVAKSLNERGVRTRKGQVWSPTTVSIILKNPFYIGTYRYNYRNEAKGPRNWTIKDKDEWILVTDHHVPIVEIDLWVKVQNMLTENRRSNKNKQKTYIRKNLHIFAGLLKCSYCGSAMPATVDRARSDGWRPSIYSCSRKRRFNDCPNKYISDVTLGPFVLNYIANMMKAQRSFGKTTSIATLEKKLLRGDIFSGVAHIESIGLQEFYELLRRGQGNNLPYEPPATIQDSPESNERDLLAAEKRRKERALSRLKSLYLYDDETLSEKDYLVEHKKLMDSIAEIDARLEEIERDSSSHFTISDDEFITKASYFIMTQQLTDKRKIEYERFIRKVDPKIIKDFLNSICQNFCIKNGQIESIRFKNGMEHRFLYSDSE